MRPEDITEEAITAVVEHCNGAAYVNEEWARINARSALEAVSPGLVQFFLEKTKADEPSWGHGGPTLDVLIRRARGLSLDDAVAPTRIPPDVQESAL